MKSNQILSIVSVFVLLSALFLCGGCSAKTGAQVVDLGGSTSGVMECPHGFEADPAQGACSIYTDTNENDICDHSE